MSDVVGGNPSRQRRIAKGMNDHSPLRPRAVMAGFLTDVVASKLFMVATVLVLLDPGSSNHAPIETMDMGLVSWFMLLWGLFFTGVGGFVAGRMSPKAPMLHGMAVACVSLLYSQIFENWSPANVGPTTYLLGCVLGVVFALTGASLSRIRR